MIAVLDSVRSVHNVGSIFRTADAVGVTKLYLCGITPGPVDRFGRPVVQLTKVSLGAEKTVAWEHCAEIVTLLANLKQKKYRLVAVEQVASAQSIFDLHLTRDQLDLTAVILGSETTGLAQDVLKMCDHLVEIPQRGTKESLNVSVAFGIAVYQLSKPIFVA